MPAGVTYRPDYRGTGQLLRSPGMAGMVRDAAEDGRRYAESISPVESGTYAASFRVDTTARGGPAGDRAEATLVNITDYAAAVEWRWGYRVLGRAVDVIES